MRSCIRAGAATRQSGRLICQGLHPAAGWDNAILSLQGVESAVAVYMNGQYVGYSEDSFTPSDFDLTPYLKEGTNRLALQVFRFSSGSWIEDQDFWRFSGIFREVMLYTKPAVHLDDLRVTAEPSTIIRMASSTST